jgi:cell division protein FtsB
MKKIVTLSLITLTLINGKAFCAEYQKVNATTAKRVYTVQREETLRLDSLQARKAFFQAEIVKLDAQIAAVKGVGVKTQAELKAEVAE